MKNKLDIALTLAIEVGISISGMFLWKGAYAIDMVEFEFLGAGLWIGFGILAVITASYLGRTK